MALNTIKTNQIEDANIAEIDIADNSISNVNIAALSSSKLSGALPALNGSAVTGLTAANLVGALPALNGSVVTGLTAGNLTGALPVLDGTALTGIVSDFTPLTNSMARLALHIGAVESLAKYNMIDQVIDDYENATGVDASASSSSAERQGSTGAYYYEGQADAAAGPVDTSSNSLTLTAVGNATTSTSIIKSSVGTHSMQFDGTGDWYTIPDGTWIDLGTGDFTMDAWIYLTASGSWRAVLGSGNWGGPTTYDFTWDVNGGNNKLRFNVWDGSTETGIDMATAIVNSTWTHVAVVRSGGTLKQYLNGTVNGTTLSSTHDVTSHGVVYIGNQSRGVPWQGNIQEVRISNNARYTSNFTPSTSAFTSDSNTRLLVHGSGTAASDSMSLISTTTTALTAPTKASIVLQTEDETGTVTINTDVKAGVSRDALNYVDTTLAKISTWGSGNVYAANDVTMPGTVMTKIITVAASKLVTDGTSQATLTLTEGYTYKFDTSDSTLSGHTFSFATAADAAGSTQYTTGVTTNGTPGNAGAYTQIVVAASAPTLYYYCANHASMGGQANTPAEAATTSMRYKIETKNQSYTAGLGAYQDASSSGHTITENGTATTSTTQTKFGTHSLKFDGGSNSGHYSIPDSTDWDVQTSGANPHASPNGSYTVEFWMYQTAWPSSYCHMIGMATATFNWSIYQNAANKRIIIGWIGNWAIDFTDNKLVLNQWQHIAIVKNVANTYCYIDGVEAGLHGSSAARTENVWSYNSTGTGTGGMVIGGGGLWTAMETVEGYIDEIRISNVARYTSNFTAPTAAFTSDANTKLLIHGEAAAGSGKVTRIHGTSLAWS